MPLFTINFRRESYLREVARTRRRVVMLGAWVAYFGALTVILGLYGLNCASLNRRMLLIERQASRMRSTQNTRMDWTVGPAELAAVEQFQANPRQWRDKLIRLAAVLPTNAVLTSVAVNPENLPTPADQNKLVINGHLRVPAGQDRMRGVVQLVSALRGDSLFAGGYQNIRLASSRTSEGSTPTVEFVIECR